VLGTLLSRDHFIVRRKRSLFGPLDDCVVDDLLHGTIGRLVPERPRGAGAGLARVLGIHHYLPRSLRLQEISGSDLLRIHVSGSLLRTRLAVSNGQDQTVGLVRQRDLLWKRRFDLISPEGFLGVVQTESDRGWRFRILDASGADAGTITRRLSGKARHAWLRGGDYDLRLSASACRELRLLALAVALTIDLAFLNREADTPI
jgi:hypothetical protein